MLKQKRQFFELLLLVADVFFVSIAWLVAYWLRFGTDWVPAEKGVPDFGVYLAMVLLIWLIWGFVYKKMGLYKPMRGVKRTKEVILLFNANALSLIVFIALTYLFAEKQVEFSRLVFVYFGILSFIFTIVERSFMRIFLREIRSRGYNLRYMLLVGAGKVANDIVKRVRLHRELGIQLVGCLDSKRSEETGPSGLKILGAYEDLKEVLATFDIDQVIVGLPLEDTPKLTQIIQELNDTTVDVKIVPDLYRFISLGGYIEEFEGLPSISLQESRMNLTAKRIIDFLLSIALILVFSPIMLFIALLVKLTSRGPIFYAQERVSYVGTPFSILKFRTMKINAETNGPGWTKENDSRVTLIGGFLRASSLDELPQLFNVFRGDMSLVGPRPERPVYIKDFRKRIPGYMLRHKVPAGMTGWAQINGWRGDTSIDKRIEHDLFYIENWSLFLDIKILILTLFRGFRNSNAY